MRWRYGPEPKAEADSTGKSASDSGSAGAYATGFEIPVTSALQYLHDCDPRDCNIVNHSVGGRHLSDVRCYHGDVKK